MVDHPTDTMLADAGPHPNPAKAATGQQLRRLEPDPVTAPIVQRIFNDFLAGKGIHAIARALTKAGIPSPSAQDPNRNRHRLASGPAWPTHRCSSDPRQSPLHRIPGLEQATHATKCSSTYDDVALGHDTRMRGNDPSDWIWSNEPSHEPLITRQQWDEVQERFRKNRRTSTRKPKAGRRYMLAGRIRCGHVRPAYGRQLEPQSPLLPLPGPPNRPASTAMGIPPRSMCREEAVTSRARRMARRLFDTEHLDATCPAARRSRPARSRSRSLDREEIRKRIAKLDRELESYRNIVRTEPEAGATVGRWIAETAQERRRLEAFLGNKPSTQLTKDEVKALVASLRDIAATLAAADPTDKAAVYEEMGIDVTYHQDGRVLVESRPRVVSDACRRGDLNPHALLGH